MEDPTAVDDHGDKFLQQPRTHSSSCHRPLSRASRQLFRQEASSILLHYFGGKSQDAEWRRHIIDNSPKDPTATVDKSGRRRVRISLMEDPIDGLTDEEWYALLSYAIDKSSEQYTHLLEAPICPLHPKHDPIQQDDQNSYLIKRRHRTGFSKFGGLSLPLSGRAARAALWMEVRQRIPLTKQSRQLTGNTVFLFQCGLCEKTFVSRYYLDKHMATHHVHHFEADEDSAANHLSCPAYDVCEALGGIATCVEVMNQISPCYGRGPLKGKDYVAPISDSFFSSSIHSLVSLFQPGDGDTVTTTEAQVQKPEQATFAKIVGEMHHRYQRRNKMILQRALSRRKEGHVFFEDETELTGAHEVAPAATDVDNDLDVAIPSTSCDEKEMERLFQLCRGMMQTCFRDSLADGVMQTEDNSVLSLAHDLITQICEPIHCHHRLHRMAGHDPRHVAHWNDQWEEHHSFELGLFGWIAVLAVIMFYGCTYACGIGVDDDMSNGQETKKSL